MTSRSDKVYVSAKIGIFNETTTLFPENFVKTTNYEFHELVIRKTRSLKY